MKQRKTLNIALVKPPITGHQYRGTGIYTENIYIGLKKVNEISVNLISVKDGLERFDLIHYPYFDPFFLTLPLLKKRPTVVTVHDLIPLKFPRYFPKGVKGYLKWQIQKFSLGQSDAIITDSYSSKEDIIKYAGINKDKIRVIYLGIGDGFKIIESKKILESIKKKFKLPHDFLLHVGDVNYNKNIEGLIKVFAIIHKSYPDLELLLVGSGFINNSWQLQKIKHLIDSLNLADKVHFLAQVSIDDLVGIYNLAKVYLQLSLAEGFGLPVLEAMACGCPVVASNQSSLSEIAGDSSILVDPKDYPKAANAVTDLLADASKYRYMKSKGLARVKMFNWEKTAKQTIEVYKKVINNSSRD